MDANAMRSSYPINFSGSSPIFNDREEKIKKMKRDSWPARKIKAVMEWLKRRSLAVKIALAMTVTISALVALKLTAKHQYHFFIVAEVIHAAGLLVLAYKLTTHKSCSGISSKSQEVTAIFLGARLVGGIMLLKLDFNTVIDSITLMTTAWVIYMIRFKLNNTYDKAMDNFHLYFLVLPSFVLALMINPYSHPSFIVRVFWAFGTYLESVSVLPQLRLMQNAKMIEPFTALYVFALGISRFMSFAHWLIQVYEYGGRYLFLIGSGYLWFLTAFLSEIIQTFILADFCYYYIKSLVEGRLRIPV